MLSHYLHVFASDDKLHGVFVLILADLIFGVLAAFKTHTFVLKRLSDVLHDDVLGKVLPWFGLYAFGLANASAIGVGDVTIDFGTIADGAFIAVIAALTASIYGSLRDLGVNLPGAHIDQP